MTDLALELKAEYGDRFLALPAEEAISALSAIGLAKVLAWIRASAERLRIYFDRWYSERSLYAAGGVFEHVIADLRARGVTRVEPVIVAEETVEFRMPDELRVETP